ncbi:response regulator [Simiduia sp. 21SJ11W-1]|uniref:response regulator n=1 Tax=Simiduia sp. 21SJ11W-1 TaxID=2909669 RepID=UPI0020A13EF1|nr:response regulator [Simiduia sp. 21SJ11W-1]UTA47057.1 response regulator [Simiduia sp. 21SJ11W-1]
MNSETHTPKSPRPEAGIPLESTDAENATANNPDTAKCGSIRNELLRWLIPVTLIPLILVATATYVQTSNLLKGQMEAALTKESNYIKGFINNWFDYRYMDLQRKAKDPKNAEIIERINSRFTPLELKNGNLSANYQWELIASDYRQSHIHLINSYDYIKDIYLVDNSGHLLFATFNSQYIGRNLFTGNYPHKHFANAIRASIQSGTTSFSDLASNNDGDTALIAAPVTNTLGDRIGAVAIEIELKRIKGVLKTTHDYNIVHYLVGTDGKLRNNTLALRESPGAHTVDTDLVNAWINLPGENLQQGVNEYTGPSGRPVFGTQHEITVMNQRWLLVSEIDKNLALLPATWLAWIIASITLAAIFVATAIIFYVSGRLTKPIADLSLSVQQAAQEGSNQQVNVHANNELKMLANSVNAMLDARHKYEQNLISARIAAENAAKAKSEFLAVMSHEIRTPMNGVLGMLKLMINRGLDNAQTRMANMALSSANSLLNVINDILDYSKAEAGKIELEAIDFNLARLTADIANQLAIRAEERDCELILDLTEVNTSSVKGDPARFTQVINNLVGNAIKFTEGGDVIIKLHTRAEADSQTVWVTLTISDTGIGIPEDKLTHLFDAFTQVDSSTTRKYGGSGLGLAIVKKIVSSMEGTITAASEVGKGSTFTVQVPMAAGLSEQHSIPDVDMSTLHILIVDDNSTNRYVLRGQLEIWGASVEEAQDGQSALNLLEYKAGRRRTDEQPIFHIALLDMNMPGMDGMELGKRMQADPRYSAIKLVMMTSQGHLGEHNEFAAAGFRAYFPKPVNTDDLLNALAIISTDDETTPNKAIVTHSYLQSFSMRHQQALTPNDTAWAQNARIIMAEDNAINQEVALGMLLDLVLEVDVAIHGRELLNKLLLSTDSAPYQLILMDCQMPEMDGYEATRRIRMGDAGASYANIPIVGLSANAMESDRKLALAAGMDDYITKPLEMEDLVNCLKRWLTKNSAPNPMQTAHLAPPQAAAQPPKKVITKDETQAAIQNTPKEELSAPPLDYNALLRRTKTPERAHRILQLFVQEAPRLAAEIETCYTRRDHENTQLHLHSLKGVAANVGATALADYCLELEQLAKGHELIDTNLEHLRALVEQALSAAEAAPES